MDDWAGDNRSGFCDLQFFNFFSDFEFAAKFFVAGLLLFIVLVCKKSIFVKLKSRLLSGNLAVTGTTNNGGSSSDRKYEKSTSMSQSSSSPGRRKDSIPMKTLDAARSTADQPGSS